MKLIQSILIATGIIVASIFALDTIPEPPTVGGGVSFGGNGSSFAGGGGITSLTPWTSAIDGGGFSLSNVLTGAFTNITATNATTTNATSTNSVIANATITTSVVTTETVTGFTSTNATSTGTLTVPVGAAPSVAVSGNVAIDTTSDQLIGFAGTAKKVYGNGNIYAGFTYATSTTWTGTSTIPLGTARVGETWNDVQCYTDVGTVNVSFYDGTNRMNMFNASTTVGTVVLSTNNTFTAAEKRYVDIGTPATSPTKLSCTVSKSITAD